MDNNEEWKEFLNHLLSNTTSQQQKSKEYEYLKQRQTQIDEILSTNLTKPLLRKSYLNWD